MPCAKHVSHVAVMLSTIKKKTDCIKKIWHEELVQDKFVSRREWETISTEQAKANNKENVPYARISI